jgi:hypothetical protein
MPAMIAFEYEEGKVFLTGPHPEWEEDSFRDGCVWDNYLDEDGSDWNLCKTISLWLTPSIPPSQVPTNLVLISSIGVIALVILLIWFVREKLT